MVVGVDGRITSPRITQWIQYKLGKQYLWKKSYTTCIYIFAIANNWTCFGSKFQLMTLVNLTRASVNASSPVTPNHNQIPQRCLANRKTFLVGFGWTGWTWGTLTLARSSGRYRIRGGLKNLSHWNRPFRGEGGDTPLSVKFLVMNRPLRGDGGTGTPLFC